MSLYAKNTSVSVEKSRAEIESILSRYGATAFAYATQQDKAMIQFHADGRRIMFVLNLPDKTERRFTHSKRGTEWVDEHAYKLWEQACRQIWRCLALAIKAKLEAVESGIASFEDVARLKKTKAQKIPRNGSIPGRIYSWWSIEPDVGRVAHGVPSRVDRLKCLGNAVVPQVAQKIGEMILKGELQNAA